MALVGRGTQRGPYLGHQLPRSQHFLSCVLDGSRPVMRSGSLCRNPCRVVVWYSASIRREHLRIVGGWFRDAEAHGTAVRRRVRCSRGAHVEGCRRAGRVSHGLGPFVVRVRGLVPGTLKQGGILGNSAVDVVPPLAHGRPLVEGGAVGAPEALLCPTAAALVIHLLVKRVIWDFTE